MKVVICVFPGSNCDRDMAVAIRTIIGTPPIMLWHKQSELPKADLIILPGGFSYGDYLRAGSIAAHSPIMSEIIKAAQAGVKILGVCNGFQILTEAGLLEGALIGNHDRLFICQEVFVKIEQCAQSFTSAYQKDRAYKMSIAHNQGNYQASPQILAKLEDKGLIALRYCDDKAQISPHANPNGSALNIAGITNEKGNILGMMPHPERHIDDALSASLSGVPLFESLQL